MGIRQTEAMRPLVWVMAVGLIGACASDGWGALAGSTRPGFSGKLSSNRAVRKQQLIADPATPSPSDLGAPRRGSSSVDYDPTLVTLTDVELGTGYSGSGRVEVTVGGRPVLQDLVSFLAKPSGPETGYVQLFFHHGLVNGPFPRDNLRGPSGEPGQMDVAGGYTTYDTDGVAGFDTHAFTFDYLPGVADTTVATYDIFANKGGRASADSADFLVGRRNGREFTLTADQLSSATVRASLVPLPPAVWAGAATLAGAVLLVTVRNRRARRAA